MEEKFDRMCGSYFVSTGLDDFDMFGAEVLVVGVIKCLEAVVSINAVKVPLG